ncbi:MAG: TetR family transcriptional regulator [Planctomycetales bacterium]|nr:TetR family transcriptional regulator [Planctomycetales bacterium]NIP67998.1 TetR family transcriptional regulator [Planctomycetales bacterium]
MQHKSPEQRRVRLLPILTQAFIELGFRRATTAELAARCQLRENELYRLWKNKKAMFIDAVQQVYDSTLKAWSQLSVADESTSMAQRVLAHQAIHQGRMGFYRIVFAGLQETDDTEIKAALRNLYRKFHASIVEMMIQHHAVPLADMSRAKQAEARDRAELAAWAMIGLGAIADIDRCVNLTSATKRQHLMKTVGKTLLDFPVPATVTLS